jgi:CRP/FNR family transcriptional regulator
LKVPAASLTQPLDKLCQVCPARPLSICANLEGSSLHRLAGMMTHREFSAHQEIIHQEETSNLVAIIISGLVKLTRLLPDGREQIVAILSRGHSIGEVYEDLSHDSVQCITDVTLCCFRKTEFERVLESEPAIEREFVSRLQHDLNDARDWLTVLGKADSPREGRQLPVLSRQQRGLHRDRRQQRRATHQLAAAPCRDRRISWPDHRNRQPQHHPSAPHGHHLDGRCTARAHHRPPRPCCTGRRPTAPASCLSQPHPHCH